MIMSGCSAIPNDICTINLEDKAIKRYKIEFDFNGPDYAVLTKDELYNIAYLHSRERQNEIIQFLENMQHCSEHRTWHKKDEFILETATTTTEIMRCDK